MQVTTFRAAYASIVGLLVVGLLLAGLNLWNVDQQAAVVNRDIKRTNDLAIWQKILNDYQAANQRFPASDSSQSLEPLEREQGAPVPPTEDGPHYSYAADAAGSQYVLCTPLEGEAERRADQPPQARFVTASGSFGAAAEHCGEPRVQVANFVTATALTDAAADHFMRIPTSIEPKERVRERCAGAVDTQTAVYGCFVLNDDPPGTITILQITDPGLASQTDVIAVHEFLHAAYEELSDEERDKLNVLLEEQSKQPGYGRLAEELEIYDAANRPSELHSRLATEFTTLSPPLEDHYRRYLRNRQNVVSKYEPYRALLTNLRNLELQLEQSKRRLDALSAAGNIEEYNSDVAPFNSLVIRYNQLAERYNLLTR